jgi:hypothetical protein
MMMTDEDSDTPPPDHAFFWQTPGDRWEQTPLVPYTSFSEYRRLVDELLADYMRLIKCTLDWYTHNPTLDPWLMDRFGLPVCISRRWLQDGRQLLLRLTKGTGARWCDTTNACLVNRLESATMAYVCALQLSPNARFATIKPSITRRLRRELRFFVEDRNLNTLNAYSFHHKNFKFCGIAGETLADERERLAADTLYVPTAQFQTMILAFAMGTHARLGGERDCHAGRLHEELLRLVFAYRIF